MHPVRDHDLSDKADAAAAGAETDGGPLPDAAPAAGAAAAATRRREPQPPNRSSASHRPIRSSSTRPSRSQPTLDAAEAAAAGGEPAVGSDDTEGARLIALNMALNGTPREETDRYLAENFKLSDRVAAARRGVRECRGLIRRRRISCEFSWRKARRRLAWGGGGLDDSRKLRGVDGGERLFGSLDSVMWTS